MSVQVFNDMWLPGADFLGLDCIPVKERQKTGLVTSMHITVEIQFLFFFFHIQTYKRIREDTYTHSHALCPHLPEHTRWECSCITLGVMQEHSLLQPGCQGCQRFQANSFKTPQFIPTLTAKVVLKRPCETCLCQVVHTSTSSTWCVRTGDTSDSAESHFYLQKCGCWQKRHFLCL